MKNYKIYSRNKEFYYSIHFKDNLSNCDGLVKLKYKIDPSNGHPIPGKCGDVYFKISTFKSEVITHESVHMGIGYVSMFKCINLNDNHDDEELLAYNIGWFAKELSNLFWELKDKNII